MINIISEVNKYLKAHASLYASITQNAFVGTESEAIICVQEPSEAVVIRYLDGSRSSSLNFSYYTKSKSQVTAREQLDVIINALDLADMRQITEGLFVSIQAVTLPSYVEKTDIGEHVFTVTMKLDYIGG